MEVQLHDNNFRDCHGFLAKFAKLSTPKMLFIAKKKINKKLRKADKLSNVHPKVGKKDEFAKSQKLITRNFC